MGFLVGLDLGGTNMKAAVLESDSREVLDRRTRATDRRGPDRTIAALVDFAADVVADFPVAEGPIGVTLPGHFDHQGRATVIPNIPGNWPGTPVRAPVATAVGGEVLLINDARAFGLAESRVGAARDVRTMIGLVLGTGVGGCLVLDGRLYLGRLGTAGEIGHQVLAPDGPECGCGNRGCLEALVRADVLAAAAGTRTVDDAVRAAQAGDHRAAAAIRTAAEWIGIGLGNLVTVLTPECVVIGGGLAAAGPTLFDPVVATLRQRTPLVPSDSVQVLPAALGPWAGAIGAALASGGT
ncbi:MAG: ROK family protein [Propionibacteriaceae bacterium]